MRILIRRESGVRATGSRLGQDRRSGRALARAASWAVLPWVAAACGQPAAPEGAPAPDDQLVTIRVIPDTAPVAAGETFHVVVVFEIEPNWHIYWKSPGAGAMAPRVRLEAPPGFKVGRPLWPRPSVVESPLGPEYSYADEVALFVPVEAPGELEDGSVTFTARADWAVCSNVCRLGSAQKQVIVETTSRRGGEPRPPEDPVVAKYRRRLPVRLDQTNTRTRLGPEGITVIVTGPARGLHEVSFLPEDCPGVVYGSWSGTVNDDRFELHIPVVADPNNALGEPMAVRGLVALGRELDDPCYDFEVGVDGAGDQE